MHIGDNIIANPNIDGWFQVAVGVASPIIRLNICHSHDMQAAYITGNKNRRYAYMVSL